MVSTVWNTVFFFFFFPFTICEMRKTRSMDFLKNTPDGVHIFISVIIYWGSYARLCEEDTELWQEAQRRLGIEFLILSRNEEKRNEWLGNSVPQACPQIFEGKYTHQEDLVFSTLCEVSAEEVEVGPRYRSQKTWSSVVQRQKTHVSALNSVIGLPSTLRLFLTLNKVNDAMHTGKRCPYVHQLICSSLWKHS